MIVNPIISADKTTSVQLQFKDSTEFHNNICVLPDGSIFALANNYVSVNANTYMFKFIVNFGKTLTTIIDPTATKYISQNLIGAAFFSWYADSLVHFLIGKGTKVCHYTFNTSTLAFTEVLCYTALWTYISSLPSCDSKIYLESTSTSTTQLIIMFDIITKTFTELTFTTSTTISISVLFADLTDNNIFYTRYKNVVYKFDKSDLSTTLISIPDSPEYYFSQYNHYVSFVSEADDSVLKVFDLHTETVAASYDFGVSLYNVAALGVTNDKFGYFALRIDGIYKVVGIDFENQTYETYITGSSSNYLRWWGFNRSSFPGLTDKVPFTLIEQFYNDDEDDDNILKLTFLPTTRNIE